MCESVRNPPTSHKLGLRGRVRGNFWPMNEHLGEKLRRRVLAKKTSKNVNSRLLVARKWKSGPAGNPPPPPPQNSGQLVNPRSSPPSDLARPAGPFATSITDDSKLCSNGNNGWRERSNPVGAQPQASRTHTPMTRSASCRRSKPCRKRTTWARSHCMPSHAVPLAELARKASGPPCLGRTCERQSIRNKPQN